MDTIYMRTNLDKNRLKIFPILICCFLGRGECGEKGGSSIIILRLVSGYSVTSDTILQSPSPASLDIYNHGYSHYIITSFFPANKISAN